MTFITTRDDAARSALGSDVVLVNGWGFISNLLPIDLDNDRTPLPEGIERQVQKIFANLDVLLGQARLGRENVVRVSIYMTEFPRLYDRMNAAYAGFFAAGRLPARSCIGVSNLVRGSQVAMDFVLSEMVP
ncbi:MAG TPA: RidA family protein [Stellaceae bacterium]|jgi:enamine deaminase RidA (YjgF/YER057c/UK114 family)